MKKALSLTLAVCAFASPAWANETRIYRSSERVASLVKYHAEKLPARDRAFVESRLQDIIDTFRDNKIDLPTPVPQTFPSNRNLICDSSNNTLNDLDNSRQIFDFSNPENCQEALLLVKQGKPFCENDNNTLQSPEGKLIYDFSSPDVCREAAARVTAGKNFCDYNDNTLHRADGALVYDFSNPEDCKKGLN